MTPISSPAEPTIHEAELASGASGAVIRGKEIDFDIAVIRRKSGNDVVVCGNDRKGNRGVARNIEAQVGPYVYQMPHTISAGAMALPHYQQKDASHRGHTFYETSSRRSVRKSP